MKYNLLANTGVLVSELCLGAMTFGGKGWWEAIGKTDQDAVNALMKLALDSGINFFDTANVYSEGLSETMIGHSFAKLGISRQHFVLATKLRSRMGQGANQVGLSRLHIADAVNDSLKRLQMDHIDLLYIHGVDTLTPLEETMRGLEDAVRSGKVRYLGVSNHPAWMIAKANGIAEKMGWTRFAATQSYYTIASREIERELIPMALSENLALMPWSPLAGGFLSGKYSRTQSKAGESRRDNFDFPPLNKEKAYDIIETMEEIAAGRNVSVAQVALAWMLKKPGVTSIIIGAKNLKQLQDNIRSTELTLAENEMKRLDEISELPPEYPAWMMERQMSGRLPD